MELDAKRPLKKQVYIKYQIGRLLLSVVDYLPELEDRTKKTAIKTPLPNKGLKTTKTARL